ncbi:hypothetical protein HMPREF9120_01074 [Neisseria sp. oral taxon 020 str. F0370]|nr:hypothetical protein HMPREF9120_01074 [Neisseria sp. oral taxon 020 str. F0370]
MKRAVETKVWCPSIKLRGKSDPLRLGLFYGWSSTKTKKEAGIPPIRFQPSARLGGRSDGFIHNVSPQFGWYFILPENNGLGRFGVKLSSLQIYFQKMQFGKFCVVL